ncbi:potassium-transporting ATPase subunit KdpC [Variovorax guangxiensis]|uniref:Potassium-transporting ATPase KdpC subunit n=1 Tax=Variovorax guangxiensis TaxID=1775474 RepID=A0A840G1P1_9BURK|nr:potassium-transporting ATPase subunit KdpC [Variovorax guangxiensis]MBB4222818.1 K+-transporting ATPase ATPase C chain [Variovorax guangxiensis]
MNNNTINGNGGEGGIVRPALVLFVLLSALTGLIYPMAVTGVAKAAFPAQAAGSLIVLDGTAVGSKLIGQNFSDPKHFWGRPSATAPQPYNASASGGSNQGPLNPALTDAVKARVEALRAADPDNVAPVPVDLVTASASGLDPDISPAAAQYQAARVARVRGMPLAQVQSLIDRNTQQPLLGFLGEPRVNVLALNIALDAASGSFSPSTPR